MDYQPKEHAVCWLCWKFKKLSDEVGKDADGHFTVLAKISNQMSKFSLKQDDQIADNYYVPLLHAN